jgi:hypothetical protein
VCQPEWVSTQQNLALYSSKKKASEGPLVIRDGNVSVIPREVGDDVYLPHAPSYLIIQRLFPRADGDVALLCCVRRVASCAVPRILLLVAEEAEDSQLGLSRGVLDVALALTDHVCPYDMMLPSIAVGFSSQSCERAITVSSWKEYCSW